MLYTIVPLDRIYYNQTTSIVDEYKAQGLLAQDDTSEFVEFSITHGGITARREGDRFVVKQIKSTNMEDYLNPKYAPGSDIEF